MEIALLQVAIILIGVWFVWRVIAGLFGPRRRAEPAEPAEHGRDDYAGVPARLRPRPKAGAGAVALARLEDDEENLPGVASSPPSQTSRMRS